MLDFVCEHEVFLGHNIACIVGAQSDLDLVVDIVNFRVVVHFLSLKSHACQKTKGITEGLEIERLGKRVVLMFPVRKVLQQ